MDLVVDAEQAVLDQAGLSGPGRRAEDRLPRPPRSVSWQPRWIAPGLPNPALGPWTHPQHPDPAPCGAAPGATWSQRNMFTERRQAWPQDI